MRALDTERLVVALDSSPASGLEQLLEYSLGQLLTERRAGR